MGQLRMARTVSRLREPLSHWREWATNHLFGRGWWVWIIPLQGGDVSAGIVYDSRGFSNFQRDRLWDNDCTRTFSNNPVGHEIFGAAKVIEGDVHALSMLPYYSEKVCDNGWAMVGDAAGFIDPLYSPGLDFCSYTSYYVADLLRAVSRVKTSPSRLHHYNHNSRSLTVPGSRVCTRTNIITWVTRSLMSAAFLLDVSSYYAGLVRRVYRDPEREFLNLPFSGRWRQIRPKSDEFLRSSA